MRTCSRAASRSSEVQFYADGEVNDDNYEFEDDDAPKVLDLLRRRSRRAIVVNLIEDMPSVSIWYKGHSYFGVDGAKKFLAENELRLTECGQMRHVSVDGQRFTCGHRAGATSGRCAMENR